MHAVAGRFVQEIYQYDASNLILVNLLIYLRAVYYQYDVSGIANPIPNLAVSLRPYIKQGLEGDALYRDNSRAPSTANELMKLITNMRDEAYYLPTLKNRIASYTVSAANPQAAAPLLQRSAAGGFTGLLTVFFYAHQRSGATDARQRCDAPGDAQPLRHREPREPVEHERRLSAGRRGARNVSLPPLSGAEAACEEMMGHARVDEHDGRTATSGSLRRKRSTTAIRATARTTAPATTRSG